MYRIQFTDRHRYETLRNASLTCTHFQLKNAINAVKKVLDIHHLEYNQQTTKFIDKESRVIAEVMEFKNQARFPKF